MSRLVESSEFISLEACIPTIENVFHLEQLWFRKENLCSWGTDLEKGVF